MQENTPLDIYCRASERMSSVCRQVADDRRSGEVSGGKHAEGGQLCFSWVWKIRDEDDYEDILKQDVMTVQASPWQH